MATEPTSPRTQQGDNEESPAQPGDSPQPKRPPQHQQGDGKKPKPTRFSDWASI